MTTNNSLKNQPLNNIKVFFGILILFSIISLLNIPVLVTLWRYGFDDGTYSHAYLIPFITLFLYYQLAQIGKLHFRDKFSVVATLFFITSGILLFITSNAQLSIGYWLSLLLLGITSVGMLFRFNCYILFPAAFLIFIFPFWGVLTAFLQNISIAAVNYMMSFTGIPTFVDATFVTIPAGVFEIAGGCSGLRYLIVSLAISSLFIFLYIKDIKRATLFFVIAISGALLTNWIRITALIVIGEYTNMQSSLMADHNTFGWYLYIPFMVLLFAWGNRLADHDLLNSTTKLEQNTQTSNLPDTRLVFALIACLALSSTTLKSFFIPAQEKTVLNASNDHAIKPSINYYSSVNILSGSDGGQSRIYHFDGSELDGKPTFYGNNMVPEGWSITEQKMLDNWQVYYIRNAKATAVVLTQYKINGEAFAKSREFKIKRIMSAMQNIKATELHWKFVPCETSCEHDIVQAL